jgi:hypothetical protein
MNPPRLPSYGRFALDGAAGAGAALLMMAAALQLAYPRDFTPGFLLAGLRREALWSLPAAVAAALLLRLVYAHALAGRWALPALLGIPRTFLVFPLVSWLSFLTVSGALLSHPWKLLRARLGGAPPPPKLDDVMDRCFAWVVWYGFLPLLVANRKPRAADGLPAVVPMRALLWRFLLFFPLCFVLAHEEERPMRYAGALGLLFADYLVVALRVAPAVAEKLRRDGAAGRA